MSVHVSNPLVGIPLSSGTTTAPFNSGSPTQPTFTSATPTTSGEASDLYAILPLSGTTITASAIAGTTGLAVVDGTTLTWRHGGITLSDGQEVSLGFYGLEDASTTATYSSLPSRRVTQSIPLATATASSMSSGASTSSGSVIIITGTSSQPASSSAGGGTSSAASSTMGSSGTTSASASAATATNAGTPRFSVNKAAALVGIGLALVTWAA